MSAEGERVNADGRMRKAKKNAARRSAELAARRREIREAGAIAIAFCPEHGLHGQRTECYVCGDGVELVAMVRVEERDNAVAILRDWVEAVEALPDGTALAKETHVQARAIDLLRDLDG